jgi:hypothetical protein
VLKQEQIDEWMESLVTVHVLELLKQRLEETYELRASVFFPGEPNRTQETKAHLIGEEGALNDIIRALEEKDLSEIYEAEEQADEQIGHSPERGSRPN